MKFNLILAILFLGVMFITTWKQYTNSDIEGFETDQLICTKPANGAIRTNDGRIIPNGKDANCLNVPGLSDVFLCGGKTTQQQNDIGFFDNDCEKKWYVDNFGNVCDKNDNDVEQHVKIHGKCPGPSNIRDEDMTPIEYSNFIPTPIMESDRDPTDVESLLIGRHYIRFYNITRQLDFSATTTDELKELGRKIVKAYQASKTYIMNTNYFNEQKKIKTREELNTYYKTISEKVVSSIPTLTGDNSNMNDPANYKTTRDMLSGERLVRNNRYAYKGFKPMSSFVGFSL